MATATPSPQSLDDKHHFLLRKLHSLSGIVPIGVFLIEHLLTNSMAFYGRFTETGGRGEFNEAVGFIAGLPYLVFLEIFGIFLPILFHAVYGMKIALSADYNTGSYPYMDNRRYTLQRVTGYIAFVFLIVHLAKFRFGHWFGFTDIPFLESGDYYETTRNGLLAWNISGFTMPAAITICFYLLGLWAACYHFANGIWSFCVSWGITVGERAQKLVGRGAAALGIVLFLWGAAAIYGFTSVEPVKDSKAMIAQPTGDSNASRGEAHSSMATLPE